MTGRGENIAQAEATQRTEQRDSNAASRSGAVHERLPTPASLAEVMQSSRQFINEQVAESLQVCYLVLAYLLNMFPFFLFYSPLFCF